MLAQPCCDCCTVLIVLVQVDQTDRLAVLQRHFMCVFCAARKVACIQNQGGVGVDYILLRADSVLRCREVSKTLFRM